MATVEPTQALLNEIANPSFLTRDEVQAFIRHAAPFAVKLAQQGMAELGNVQLANLSEADADLKGSLENYRQKAAVKQRLAQDLMQILNTLRTNDEKGAEYDAETRVKARRLGYETGLPEVEVVPEVPVGAEPAPPRVR